MFVLGTLPQHAGWWIIECSCLFMLRWVEEYGQRPHAYSLCMANTISRKIRLHIMNEKWVHTCIHTKSTGPQSNTHARTHTCILVFLQRKLVLINLAGGTRHVFPFTSWPVPWVAQSKPSILVCLQFVCLNFLLICIIHWWPVGLAQEVLSEDCRGIYFTQTSYIIFSFSFSKKKKCISMLDHLPLPLLLRMNVSGVLKCFSIDSLWTRAAEGEDYQHDP